ncbi:unnamed protein product [Penicillium salamii]|uniref:Uncharacterized protein n=1 Tax=Penicillium salamii TaxID=1612424 RepID=A0A9W4IDP1_9EURO|nr:unnamed protein product [Penicillium salamii]
MWGLDQFLGIPPSNQSERFDILPYGDILHSRLVNSLFNKTLWPTSASLDHPEAIFTV